VRNPYTTVPTWPLQADIHSRSYQHVARFTGNLHVQTEFAADLMNNTVSLNQVDKNFEVETLYTLRFRPTNPIPPTGWVKVVYPRTVGISDEGRFVKECQAVTSLSFTGEKYCMLDTRKREIWFFDIFRQVDRWTSEVALNLNFTNPVSNFFATLTEEE
jgi:hypothetical protein